MTGEGRRLALPDESVSGDEAVEFSERLSQFPEEFATGRRDRLPNPFGVHDMCGNVSDWTFDLDGRDYYARSRVDDPQGPDKGYLRVLRSWYWIFTGPACKDLLATSPWIKSRFVGFRVVCEPVDDPHSQ